MIFFLKKNQLYKIVWNKTVTSIQKWNSLLKLNEISNSMFQKYRSMCHFQIYKIKKKKKSSDIQILSYIHGFLKDRNEKWNTFGNCYRLFLFIRLSICMQHKKRVWKGKILMKPFYGNCLNTNQNKSYPILYSKNGYNKRLFVWCFLNTIEG